VTTVPFAERADVSMNKLRDYCLNPLHEEGRHKARVFAARLGMTAGDRLALRGLLLRAVLTEQATLSFRDQYGQRYAVDFSLVWQGRRADLRSAWILERGSDTPRLTACYVL